MPVSIKSKSKLNPTKVLQTFGWENTVIQLEEKGVKFVITPLAFKFVFNGKVLCGCAGKPSVWEAVVNGELDQAAFDLYHTALNDAVYQTCQKVGLAASQKVFDESAQIETAKAAVKWVKGTEGKVATTAMELLTGDKNGPEYAAQKAPQATIPGWPYINPAELMSAPKVALKDAHAMYQPVFTTSKEKRYFLVGGNEDLRIAARYGVTNSYGAGQLSIRVEGPNLGKYKEQLYEAGLGGDKGGYLSIHLTVSDRVEAQKALGAVLMGVGVPLETPLPDLGVIEGKG